MQASEGSGGMSAAGTLKIVGAVAKLLNRGKKKEGTGQQTTVSIPNEIAASIPRADEIQQAFFV